ncbi:hypothetical protein [Haloferax volcanii]|uniref:hypothetical protein n=1 Tax=Haloferax volcanii TaxID=2246 RepID=UPI00249CD5DE|nr:hypothetical protein [Haloferax alexandrinus]WEL29848.1 hypothetical protein HBNXHx_1742 [Haloferax alexandrinus]
MVAESTNHFDRFDNADAAQEFVNEREQRKQEEKEEALELYGTAQELFTARFRDTFTVERHGSEIEFHRPVGASDVDLSTLEDRELVQRLKRGANLLEEFERRQTDAILGMQNGDVNLQELYEESLDGTELMRECLSAHAVDESFHDPRVWTAIFRDDDTVSEVFEDFIAEGEPEKKRKKLNALQSMLSEGNSDS